MGNRLEDNNEFEKRQVSADYQAQKRLHSRNSQSCFIAYEAFRRGYDVHPVARDASNKVQNSVAKNPLDAFEGQKRDLNKDTVVYKPSEETITRVEALEKTYRLIEKSVKKNCRYAMYFSWSIGPLKGRHIVSLELDKDEGVVEMFDPQCGSCHKGSDSIKLKLCNIATPDTKERGLPPTIIRTDNKIIKVSTCCNLMRAANHEKR